MPFSGGTYTAPSNSWNPAVSATNIDPTDWAALLADLSTALSTAILKDGQTTTTAAIPFAAGILGTTTNDSAATGVVGQYASATASGVALSNGVNANVTSVSLTAGDWDVHGVVQFAPTGATFTGCASAASSTSATLPTIANGGYAGLAGTLPASSSQYLVTPVYRISLAATTTVYLIGEADFSAGSITASGFISARRVR